MFLHTKNKSSLKEIKKTILFLMASKRIKHLGISLTKEVKDLYTENYKTLMTEIKGDEYWKTSCLHGLELILLKCPYYLKKSTDSMLSLTNSQWPFLHKGKTLLKFMWNHKRLQKAEANWRKSKARNTMLPDFKMYYKATVIETVLYSIKTDI